MSKDTYRQIVLAAGIFIAMSIITIPLGAPKPGLEWVKPVFISIALLGLLVATVVRKRTKS